MRWIILIVLISWSMVGWGQPATELKRRAKEFFVASRYEDALTTILNSRELSRTNEEGRFLLALCYFQLNKLNESLDILKTLTENDKTPYPECWFYLGKIYHARHQFMEAAAHYKIYLKSATADQSTRRLVADLIRRCANGQQLQYQPAKAFVETLGAQVNTKYDEFAPVISPNYEDRLYFSSIREGNAGGKRNAQGKTDERAGSYFSDMFFCSNEKGNWVNVQPMPYQFNSPRHEVLLDFSKNGQALIYSKGLDITKGEIIVDTFRPAEQRLVTSDPLQAPVNPQAGDESPHFYNDTLIFFASRRSGGQGGLDIYKTALRNGRWTAPENLGTDINTPYDETTPFLSRDGKTLYFSSDNSERSIGGLDVFKTIYVAEVQRWSEPKNLALPINSAADDAHFRLSNDGFTGFLSSNRKDGLGQRDLYIAYFNDYLTEQDAPTPLSPPIVEKETPVKVIEKETPTETEEDFDRSTPETGNTLFFNSESDLFTSANKRLLDQMGLAIAEQSAQKLVLTVYALNPSTPSGGLYRAITNAEKAAKYLVDKGIAAEALFMRGALPTENTDPQNAAYAMTLEIMETPEFTSKGGNIGIFDPMLHQALHYKIQIVSVKSEYKGELLLEYPHPMVEKTLTFDYLRYTVGAVNTFAQAQQLRQEIVAKGIGSAFIVPYIYGVRADKAMAKKYIEAFSDLANFIR